MKITSIIICILAGCLVIATVGYFPPASTATAKNSEVTPVNTATAPQGEVKVSISGTDENYVVGDLIEVDAVVEGIDDPSSITYDWKVLPPVEFKVWPDGSRIMLGTGPIETNYTVFLAVGILNKNEPNQQLFTRIDTITVTKDEKPDIVPPVNPPTQEVPTVNPSPKLGDLGNSAVKLVELVRTNDFYTAADLKNDANVLANNFSIVADQVRSGEIDSLGAALNKTREMNRGFDNRDAWAEWFSGLSAELATANVNGKLTPLTKVAEVWDDIANGLSSL